MNPADPAIRLQHAILHFVFASRLERPFDRAVTRGAILGVHAIESRPKIEARIWLEAKQRASLFGHPHIVAGNIPDPHRQVSCFRGETHQVRALAQRFFRASFLFDDNREQHQRSGSHQEE